MFELDGVTEIHGCRPEVDQAIVFQFVIRLRAERK